METLPPLRRDLEIIPMEHEGSKVLVVRDGLGIAPKGLALNASAARWLPYFDGATSKDELQFAITREQGGVLATGEEVDRFVGELARLGLLQTDDYRRARRRIVADFTEKGDRPAVLAGEAYPSDAGKLAESIDGIIAGAEPRPPSGAQAMPRAIAAPHIDLSVSGESYGHAYRTLRDLRPSAILLLGTGHTLEHTYSLSDKTFHTPLGKISSDTEALSRLRKAGGDACAPDDFAHRREHSLEFQLLFLQRLFPMETTPIVPVLCGPLEDPFHPDRAPLEHPGIRAFVEEGALWLREPPQGKLVVAGVDLAHVGPKFGDSETARSLEKDFRDADGEILEALEKGDGNLLFERVAGGGNRFKVCGFSALWTLLALLPESRGEVLDYRVWHEEATRSAVSFAAVAFRPRALP